MRFRNVEVDPALPLDLWPAEAIETLIDRGTRSDWKQLVAAIRTSPWGPTARTAEIVAGWGEHVGVDALVVDSLVAARSSWDEQARRRYANRIRSWRTDAGLTQRQLAELIGTSASRLSAYENARVAPTTVVLGRIEQAVSIVTPSNAEERRRPQPGISFPPD